MRHSSARSRWVAATLVVFAVEVPSWSNTPPTEASVLIVAWTDGKLTVASIDDKDIDIVAELRLVHGDDDISWKVETTRVVSGAATAVPLDWPALNSKEEELTVPGTIQGFVHAYSTDDGHELCVRQVPRMLVDLSGISPSVHAMSDLMTLLPESAAADAATLLLPGEEVVTVDPSVGAED